MRLMLMIALFPLCGLAVAAEVGQSFKIESDPNAKYTIMELGGPRKARIIVTKREGKSGISFTRRVFDCDAAKARDFGSGDTLDQMRANAKKPGKPYGLLDGSIASHAGGAACDGTEVYTKLRQAK